MKKYVRKYGPRISQKYINMIGEGERLYRDLRPFKGHSSNNGKDDKTRNLYNNQFTDDIITLVKRVFYVYIQSQCRCKCNK
jgi:hypothetical protein